MFRTPQNEAVILDAVLAQLPRAIRAQDQRIIDSGSAHRIVLIGESAVIRIARDQGVGTAMDRRQKLVDQLPVLTFRVPRSLSDVVTIDGTSAVAVEFVAGETAPPGAASPSELHRLVAELQRISPVPVLSFLGRPLAFCGGDQWVDVQLERVLPRIPGPARENARRAVEALAALEVHTDTFSHGDLGGHNVRWGDGRIVGVVDWDLSSASDRSTDIASLAAWHGFECLEGIVPPYDLDRARIRHATFVLQQAAFQILNDRSEEEIQRTISRVTARFTTSPDRQSKR